MVLDVKFERPITVREPYDVLDCVDRYCGWDIAKYLRDLFDKYADDEREIEIRADSDLQCYEEQLESNSTAFQDIANEIDELGKCLKESRLNRGKIQKRLDEIAKIISNQI